MIVMTICPVIAGSFRPGEVWQDTSGVAINAHGGGLLFHSGTYYWYGEHKIAGKAGNKAMVGVHCYSSKDLYSWNDEGIALPVSDDEKSEIVKSCVLERPKVIYNKNTGRFVMWFHLELKDKGYSAARSGVAVSETPTGPFQYLRSVCPNAGQWALNAGPELRQIPAAADVQPRFSGWVPRLKTVQQNLMGRDFKEGQMARDMTLFVDDDGKAYHIFSSEENCTTHIALLSEDYLSHAGPYVRVFPNRWMEAPAICKHAGRYYFIASGCTGWAPNAARSAVAENIFGPWLELENPCRGINPQNNLGPEKTFGGQSTYIQQVQGKKDAFIVMFDIWNPEDAIDGRYVWLPMLINSKNSTFQVEWQNQWDLSVFDSRTF